MLLSMTNQRSKQPQTAPDNASLSVHDPALNEVVKYFAEWLAERDFARIIENEDRTSHDYARRRNRP
jgi:hypothetical protein|tara:strand:+ start:3125 stop:3325 length:201 start_codon:yes stop_codon:yes gene_type:complete